MARLFEGHVHSGFLLPQGCHLRFPCCEIVCQLQALGIECLYRCHLGLSQDELAACWTARSLQHVRAGT